MLSFCRAIEAAEIDIVVFNPPLLTRDRELYLNGILQNGKVSLPNIVNIPINESAGERFVSRLIKKPSYKRPTALLNLASLAITGRDFNYPYHSLKAYFKKIKLSSSDIIVASGPPSTLFIGAREIAEMHHCKLILDYRDPWTYGYNPIDSLPIISEFKRLRSRSQENKCLEYAAAISCDSASVKRLFPKKHHHKITPILNGANLDVIKPEEINNHYNQFRIVYLGTVYDDQLVDFTFFDVLHNLLDKHGIDKTQFQVIFIGSSRSQRLHQTVARYKLEQFITVTDRMEISEAIKLAYTASAFLHLKYASRTAVDTSKHLDYLALQKAILLPMTDGGNLATLIEKDKAGYVGESAEECLSAVEDLWLRHKRGDNMRTPRSEEFLYSISRAAEANKFVELIKKYCLE